ncbi:MAG: hypothetical protein NTW86_26320 [Candidatus Sumerlaeota bacterium]|nr:hypothetical protein [Candidatus Sumerlaeota bacterium]
MSARAHPLEIRVHLIDGRVAEFYQPDAAMARRTLDLISPERIFAEPHVLVAGRHSLSAFLSASVARADFLCAPYPDWPFPGRVTEIRETPEEEYQRHFQQALEGLPLTERESPSESLFVTIGEIRLIGGESALVEIHAQAMSRIDQRRVVPALFRAPSLHYTLREGGVSFINTANVASFVFSPAPPETPGNAWLASRMSRGGRS